MRPDRAVTGRLYLAIWALLHNLTAGPCWHWVVEGSQVIAYPLCH